MGLHKLALKPRKINRTKSTKSGDVFGITIPKYIKNQFDNTYFNLLVSGNNIILESGCKNGN